MFGSQLTLTQDRKLIEEQILNFKGDVVDDYQKKNKHGLVLRYSQLFYDKPSTV